MQTLQQHCPWIDRLFSHGPCENNRPRPGDAANLPVLHRNAPERCRPRASPRVRACPLHAPGHPRGRHRLDVVLVSFDPSGGHPPRVTGACVGLTRDHRDTHGRLFGGLGVAVAGPAAGCRSPLPRRGTVRRRPRTHPTRAAGCRRVAMRRVHGIRHACTLSFHGGVASKDVCMPCVVAFRCANGTAQPSYHVQPTPQQCVPSIRGRRRKRCCLLLRWSECGSPT